MPLIIPALLLVLLGSLAARPAAAQSCTAPSFIAPPTGNNLVSTAPTGVVAPGDVAVGDFNKDGLLDFVVTDSTNPTLQIFVQQALPLGGYVSGGSIPTVGIPTSVRVADINHDGKLDVLVSTKGTFQGRVFLGNGSGGVSSNTPLVTTGTSIDASDIVVLDIDRDGLLDVVVADVTIAPPTNRGLYAFKGNGNGTFAAPAKVGTTIYGSLALADLDGDGKLDIAAATGINPAAIETFTGTGTFSPPFISVFGIGGVGPNPLPAYNTVVTGDFDHDGKQDVAIADSTQVKLYRGQGNAQLTPFPVGSFALPSGALSLQTGDVNLDGDLDLVFTTPAPTGFVGVMLGNGAGGFQLPPGLSTFPPINPPAADGAAVALGDFNGDGRTDVAAANRAGRKVGILLNNFAGNCPAASFGPAARTFSYFDPRALALGDFNGDGKADVVSASTNANQVSVLLASSALSFPTAPTIAPGFGGLLNVGGFSSPRAVAVGLFDAGAIQDLAVANGVPLGTVSILRGNGAGGFVPIGDVPVGATPVAIGIGDFNDDNQRDLAVVNQGSNNVSIRLGNGDGTFTSVPDVSVGTIPMAIAVADFDLDGRPDLAVANFGTNTVSIRLGSSAGTFTGSLNVPVGSNPVSLDVGDFNLDGRPDLVVANQGSANLSILTGNGNGTFTPAAPVFIGSSPGAVVVTKLNGDSQPDLAVTLPGISSVRVLLGSGPATFTGGTDYYVGASPQSLAQGDVTQDGRPDLAGRVRRLLQLPRGPDFPGHGSPGRRSELFGSEDPSRSRPRTSIATGIWTSCSGTPEAR